MPESFELYGYVAFLRKRWHVAAASLAASTALALGISLLQTRLYSAKVTLLIEPPASSDPRAAMAVSPIYLESLRTYEHFAGSDHLFSEAVKKFQLRDGTFRSRSIEDIKKAVLQVSIPRNTKILQIEVTLPSAGKALALATYLAEKTVDLSRQAGSFTDLEESAQGELDAANSRLEKAEARLAVQLKQRSADETLQAELDRLGERSNEVERLALVTSVTSQEEDRDDPRGKGASPAFGPTSKQAATLRAEVARLNSEIARKQKELVTHRASVELGNSEYKAALEAREGASRRVREVRGMAGNRSERISILDPGFLPERPSSPKTLLNLLAGAVLGLLFAIAYLSAEFSLQRQKTEKTRSLPWVVGQSGV